MKKFPSIAVIELKSIASGMFTSDQMVKSSPVSMIRSGTVHNGKYLIVIGGSVASVEEAYAKGIETGNEDIIDSMILPNVHKDVLSAISGKRDMNLHECIGIIETSTVSSALKSADAGIKNAKVNITEIRMADDIGGRGIVIFSGVLEEVQAAVETAKLQVTDPKFLENHKIISRIDTDISDIIKTSTKFTETELKYLKNGEI